MYGIQNRMLVFMWYEFGRQLEIINESGKTPKINVQDLKIMYPVDELIKCLPNDKASGCTVNYCAHTKHIGALHWSLTPNVSPDI